MWNKQMCNVQVDEAQGTHSNVVLIARIVFVALETITLFCIPIPLSYPTSDFIPTFIFQTLPRDEEISDAIAIEYSRSGRTTAIKSATQIFACVLFCCHEFSWVFRLFDFMLYHNTSTHYFPILASPYPNLASTVIYAVSGVVATFCKPFVIS